MKRRQLFVIKCTACEAATIVSRPHRILGWLPTDDIAHTPGCHRAARHLTVLHYAERKAALRAGGRA